MTPTTRTITRTTMVLTALFASIIAVMMLIVQVGSMPHIYAPETVPEAPVAIILGAAITPDGRLSDALADRVKTGIDLYQDDRVQQILLTGDGGAFHRDEITPMRAATEAAGVPTGAILADERGFRTYESCKRAAEEFGVTRAIVVTQRFHLARAVYLCRAVGIDAMGVPADRQPYRRIEWYWTRDLLASVKAFIDIHLWAPAPPV